MTLTLPDLITGIQETLLVNRYGRQDEEIDAYGESRRELYRDQQEKAAGRELAFDTTIAYADMIFTIQLRRVYHHEGRVTRVVYFTGGGDFKKAAPKVEDQAAVQIAAWLASQHYATAPIGCRVILHKTNDDMEPIESKVVDFELWNPANLAEFIQERLSSLALHRNTPDAELPECNEADRFALKTDAYCKCRTQCRVRDFCQQYAKVRELGVQKLAKAKSVLDFL